MRKEKPWYFEKSNIFKGLTSEEKKEIEKIAIIKTFKKGKLIFGVNDFRDEIYIVKKGSLKTFILSEDGDEITIAIRRMGSILGTTAFCGVEHRVVYAIALEDVELLSIKLVAFKKLLLSNTNVAMKVIEMLSARLMQYRMIIEDLATKDVRSRLIRFILNLSEEIGFESSQGIIVNINLTHEQIAQIIASRRQTVTNILNDFKKANLIRKERDKLIILNSKGLKKFLQGDLGC